MDHLGRQDLRCQFCEISPVSRILVSQGRKGWRMAWLPVPYQIWGPPHPAESNDQTLIWIFDLHFFLINSIPKRLSGTLKRGLVYITYRIGSGKHNSNTRPIMFHSTNYQPPRSVLILRPNQTAHGFTWVQV